MNQRRSTRWCRPVLSTLLVASALCGTGAHAKAAAPIKVACIGEHSTHSTEFSATNRETQPVGKQEYPAMLQTLLGTGYDVRNFGDCCGSVLQGYAVQETHPYVLGSNPGGGPGYQESLAFLPDIVIIGSWGRHDWGMDMAAAEVWSVAGFQQGYDDLLQRYRTLSSHPKIFVSLPIPILNGQGDVPDKGVTTSSMLPIFRAIAAKYDLPTIDLYTPFLNHMDLFKQPPGAHSEGEHVTDDGLRVIANTVFAAMTQAMADDAGADGSMARSDASSAVHDASVPGDAAGGFGGAGAGGQGSAAAGRGTAGGQAGSEMVSAAGGSDPASSPGAAGSSQSGCSCSFASRPTSTRTAVVFIAGLALAARRRRGRAPIARTR